MDKGKGLAALGILLGAGFLYAGLEKVFDFAGLGKPFTSVGFLKFGTNGSLPGSDPKAIVNPTHDLWVSLGVTIVNANHVYKSEPRTPSTIGRGRFRAGTPMTTTRLRTASSTRSRDSSPRRKQDGEGHLEPRGLEPAFD